MKYQRQPVLVKYIYLALALFVFEIAFVSWLASLPTCTSPYNFICYGYILFCIATAILLIPIYRQCFWLIEFTPQGVLETTKQGLQKKFLSWEDCKEIGLVTYSQGSNVLLYFSPKVLCPRPKSAPRRIPKEAIILAYSKEAVQDLLQYIPKSRIHNNHILDQIAQYEAERQNKRH